MTLHNLQRSLALPCALVLTLALASCGTSRKATSDSATPSSATTATAFAAADYLKLVQSHQSRETHLTAKIHVRIEMGGKSVSTSGTLRMKRDDVIQLSVVDPILGVAELGRAEFTPSRVLLIDRMNKRYIDVPYSEADFLHRADINFTTLQSLFWNEVFQPGKEEPEAAAFTFTNAQGQTPAPDDDVLLDCEKAPLRYRFETSRAKGTLQCTRISSQKDGQGQFSFSYTDFKDFSGRPFPHEMEMHFTMGTNQATLTLGLSSLRSNSDWATRTQVPSRYTKANAEKILRSLIR